MEIDENTIDYLVTAIDAAIVDSFKGKRINHNARWGCADILKTILEHAEGDRLARGELSSVSASVDLETLRASMLLFNGKRRTERVTLKYLDIMTAHGLLKRIGDAWAVDVKRILTLAIEKDEAFLAGLINDAVTAGVPYSKAIEDTADLGIASWLHLLRAMVAKLSM